MIKFDYLLYGYIVVMFGYFQYYKHSFSPTTKLELFLWITWLISIVVMLLIVFVRDSSTKKKQEQLTRALPSLFISTLVYVFLIIIIFSSLFLLYFKIILPYTSKLKSEQLVIVSGILTFLTYFLLEIIFKLQTRYNKVFNKLTKNSHNAKKKS